jgi:alpha-D-xyloside xylohydrolase
MKFFEKKEQQLFFRNDGELLMICPWGANSLRVQSSLMDKIPAGEIALKLPEAGASSVEITIADERHALIKNGDITAELFVQEWGNALQITFRDKNGEILLREVSNGGALARKARKFRSLSGENYRLTVSFESNPSEKIFGMGQYQQEVFDLKGCNLELAHRNSQASIPFYLSSLGYGFLWHNAAIGEVHFGKNTTEWVAESTKKMDYWITAGDTPTQIEQQFAACTGTVPMMPEYGLGFWQCKLRYYNQEQVLEVAREYKKRGIPIDVIVIDYYHWKRCGDWRFDKEYFPNPKAMVQELRDMGIETMVSVWPQVEWRSENFEEMKQQGLLVKMNSGVDVQMTFHGNNVFMDATNPRTREYVWDKCKKNYADYGIQTFWLDEAEPEFTNYDFELYRYHAGSVSEIGNIYPREYSRLFYEGQQSMGQTELVNLVRCAWVGSQKYGALVWSGDVWSSYEDFRKQICAGLHMGLCGIPWWTTDIGGFHGGNVESDDFKELLIRWFQFGTFCPVMRLHGLRLPGKEIIDSEGEVREWTGADNEVWSYGEEAYRIMVKFIQIREKMRDYTRSLMKEAHLKGTPVMRTLFFEFPEDKKCWDIMDEYMYGADILVAPVCHEHQLEREVYLPEDAVWIHAGTGETYEGGKTYSIPAPMETIPVFLKNGEQGYLIHEI